MILLTFMNAMTNQRRSDQSLLQHSVLFRACARCLTSLENALIKTTKCRRAYDASERFISVQTASGIITGVLDNQMIMFFDNVRYLCCVLYNESYVISN